MTDSARWLVIVVVGLLVIALIAFARGDLGERSEGGSSAETSRVVEGTWI